MGQPRRPSGARAGGHHPPTSSNDLRGEGGFCGATVRDTQADVPSAGWPGAQLAFKDSMIRGILQFTPSIAFRYVLHRCESRDIRCRESFCNSVDGAAPAAHRARADGRTLFRSCSLTLSAPWFVSGARQRREGDPAATARGATGPLGPAAPECHNRFTGRSAVQVSTMILPQVHLRKPCYDFSFL